MESGIRSYIIQGFAVLIGLIYLIRLFNLQVLSETANEDAEKEKIIYPYRGVMYDRNGHLLVANKPIFDLMVTTMNMNVQDTALFCSLLEMTKKEFVDRINYIVRLPREKHSRYKPYPFLTQISNEKYAKIQNRFDFEGFEFIPHTIRTYPHTYLANTLGYIAEISPEELERDTANYYLQGEYIGKGGIEKEYEKHLRGKRGRELIKVNAKGIELGPYKNGEYDELAQPGKDIITTIDFELQQYAERLMAHKIGSVVALEPKTGEILSIVSAPSYDPNLLSGGDFSENFKQLSQDTLKPLFNRATSAKYPPGSIFKLVQAAIYLQAGIIRDGIQYSIPVYPNMGDHSPSGMYNIVRAIKVSSNWFFAWKYKAMLERGVKSNQFQDAEHGYQIWRDHLLSFGFGELLDADIGAEKGGLVPTTQFYDRVYKGRHRWKASTIISNGIGQGEIEVVPLQMANLAAVIANKGYYYTPHMVKEIIGDSSDALARFKQKNISTVAPKHFEPVIEGMDKVVNEAGGTGYWRARLDSIRICGKTGTAENPHGEDHSVFIAFAPKDDPKIAVAVYVENAGFGGTWAAPIASLVIEKYLTRKISIERREKRILEQKFIE